MLRRSGIWSETDPDRIVELRAEQRREEEELKELQRQTKQFEAPPQLLDPNTAGKEELESIPGIGPTLASRIIAGRPYETVDALIKVKGIGEKTLEKLRPYFTVAK